MATFLMFGKYSIEALGTISAARTRGLVIVVAYSYLPMLCLGKQISSWLWSSRVSRKR